MKMVTINWHPTDRQLCQFGLTAMVLFPLAGWFLLGFPRDLQSNHLAQGVLGALLALGGVFGILGVGHPRTLQGIFVASSVVAFPISIVVGEAVLIIIYFGLFFPVAMVFRLCRRDALQRRWNRETPSYWQAKAQPANVRSYFRQF